MWAGQSFFGTLVVSVALWHHSWINQHYDCYSHIKKNAYLLVLSSDIINFVKFKLCVTFHHSIIFTYTQENSSLK